MSWSIDKVAIVDSFGKTLSVCRKGLSLESGKPIYLPLFAGECNVPAESDNSTSSNLEHMLQEKQGGIGPFTKEQNYETKEGFTVEGFPKERSTALSSSKGLGPFTKDQNLRIIERKESFNSNSFEDAGSRRSNSNPWNIVDISSDGDSNSLENSDSEKGRGFSGSNFFAKTPSPESPAEATTEFLPEIREPVLQVEKKEAGRSLKFPEITEPILRPCSARQNTRNEVHSREKQKDEIQETSSTTGSFTVQFLPERLAGILAQAERYARQTLLPLISQYTPSFVTGSRYEEPKYFPPLGEIHSEDHRESDETELIVNTERQDFERQNRHAQAGNTESVPNEEVKAINSSSTASIEIPAIVETTYVEKSGSNSTRSDAESNEWVPIGPSSTLNTISRKDFNVSRSLNWEYKRYNWSTETILESSSFKPKLDDWVPITVKSEIQIPEISSNVSSEVNLPYAVDQQTGAAQAEAETIKGSRNNSETVTTGKDERKYIPLIDPDAKELPSTSSNDILESSWSTSTFSPYSHIQKIPRPIETRSGKLGGSSTRRSMVFPYAYEKKKDPRTRYIPLIPEEDLGRSHFSIERER